MQLYVVFVIIFSSIANLKYIEIVSQPRNVILKNIHKYRTNDNPHLIISIDIWNYI